MALKIIKNVDKYREAAKLEVISPDNVHFHLFNIFMAYLIKQIIC